MFMTRQNQIEMNLIGNNQHVVFQTQFANPHQLRLRPDAADRIMRTAEDQHFHFRIGQLGFQIVKIDRIYAFLIDQTAGHGRAAAGFNRLFKRIVDRCEDRNLFTRFYKRADGDVDGRDDARKQNQPLFF